ncbi:hypothetical protein U9M48_029192, partial [Paspalum notatum var. saurae]
MHTYIPLLLFCFSTEQIDWAPGIVSVDTKVMKAIAGWKNALSFDFRCSFEGIMCTKLVCVWLSTITSRPPPACRRRRCSFSDDTACGRGSLGRLRPARRRTAAADGGEASGGGGGLHGRRRAAPLPRSGAAPAPFLAATSASSAPPGPYGVGVVFRGRRCPRGCSPSTRLLSSSPRARGTGGGADKGRGRRCGQRARATEIGLAERMLRGRGQATEKRPIRPFWGSHPIGLGETSLGLASLQKCQESKMSAFKEVP